MQPRAALRKGAGDIAALNKAFLSDYEEPVEAVEAVEASLAVL